MRLVHTFVDRPILASVVSILIVLVGAISYFTLAVEQYPQISPPTIRVNATYPGANADTVAQTVAAPIEQEINGVEGMLYMRSENTGDGRMSLTVTFRLGTNLDAAQVLVQNRVATAEARLPEAVRRLGVTVQKSSPDLMLVIHILSPDGSRSNLYISNYAKAQIVDELSRVDGVGSVTVFGERVYSMRVWLHPDRIAAYGMTASDVVSALQANNVQVAAGVLDQPPMKHQGAFQLNVETQGRLLTPQEFGNIVVKRGDDGRTVHVRDIARVELGAQDTLTIGYLDKTNALPIGVFQRPGSNALATAGAVLAKMKELSKTFPAGIKYDVVYNPTQFVSQSVDEVFKTIGEAIVLVVLVVLLFLQRLRTAVIPIVAIPVSLIGTFAVLGGLGFSLNNLSLFGLVLAIGIVVDDAIVVVENVERYLERGMSARDAAHRTMDEVGHALIAIAGVLCAVFVPTIFISGISGQFYTQFAVTIASATVISAIVSLTLSPALCAVLLRPHGAEPRRSVFSAVFYPFRMITAGFNWLFERVAGGYGKMTRKLVRMTLIMLVVYAGLIGLAAERFMATPTGFIPDTDQGYLITVIQLPPGSSLSRTDAVVRQVSAILLKIPGIEHTVAFAGLDAATFTTSSNAAAAFATLKPFSQRTGPGMSAKAILGRAFGALHAIKGASIFMLAPPPVRGVGTGGGWKMYVQDRQGRGTKALEAAVQKLAAAANRTPGLARVFSTFNTRTPKIHVDIDRTKAQMLDVPTQNLLSTLETYIGSAYVNDFNFLGRTYRVIAQADEDFRKYPEDILRLKTRSTNGAMVPLGTFASVRWTTGAYRLPRYNLYDAAALQGATAPGTSTGQAIKTMEQLAAKILPDGFGYEWTELALQEKLAGNTAMIAFALAVVFVFLLLAALYESWLLPLAVVLIVPMCLLAAVVGIDIRGISNNILVQIGFVVLIGLAAKNAILIVEFARQAEAAGASRFDAAVEAARVRLRPILMTSFAFIFGVVPLVIATGAGAEMRQSLGTAVFSGMIGVTLFGLLFTPVFYVVCRALARGSREESLPDTPTSIDRT